MQIFTLNLVLNALAECFIGKATASLCFLTRLQQSTKAPAIKPSPGPASLSEGGQPSRKPSLATALPLLTLHSVLRSGEDWAKYLLFFPSSPQKKKNNQIYRKNPRILNLRRAISITLYIITFNLLTADYKVFFNHVLQRKLNYFYLQGTHPITTYFYTCNQFCSLIFIFVLDNQGNIHSICACN